MESIPPQTICAAASHENAGNIFRIKHLNFCDEHIVR